MGKAVKHSAKLRRKSSGTIFKKRVFRGNQKTPVPKACSSQPQLINITNRDRDGSRTAATSKIEHFVIIVNGWKPLTIIIKSSILDVAAVLDPPLREDREMVLSASARKVQSSNKMNISTATTDVDDIDESTNDVDKNLPSCYLLVDSDILKSTVTIIGACPECKNS